MSAKDPKQLPKFAHPLLELMFFPKRLQRSVLSHFPSEKRFFSYTNSNNELSVIVSADNLSLLPLELFDVDPGKWRALQIVGDETGICKFWREIIDV